MAAHGAHRRAEIRIYLAIAADGIYMPVCLRSEAGVRVCGGQWWS